MKFLILNTDYPDFLSWLYDQHPGLGGEPYERQMQVRNDSLFGVADFYSSNLRKLGHEAWDIHANNECMQRSWAKEQGIPLKEATSIKQFTKRVLHQGIKMLPKAPIRYLNPTLRASLSSLDGHEPWFYDVLTAQIKHYRPDILLNQTMAAIPGYFLDQIKGHVRMLIGQIASPLPRGEDFRFYDMVISSLPNFVCHFRKLGIPSELNRLAFEPRVLNRFDAKEEAAYPLSFVGSLSPAHGERVRLLEYLCTGFDVQVWGQLQDMKAEKSPIHRCYRGQAWGVEMYRIIRNSKITLNHHIGTAESYANNSRLFEATGMGVLLISDFKANLSEMFEPDKEMAVYRTPEECAELIRYYLEHENRRQSVARAGQQRTLKEHTYYHRMQELADIVKNHL